LAAPYALQPGPCREGVQVDLCDRQVGRSDGSTAAQTPPPVRQVIGLLVPGLAALALLAHALTSATVDRTARLGLNYFQVNWGELAVAGTLALLTCTCAAALISAALPVDRLDTALRGAAAEVVAARRFGVGLLAATGAGLAVACLFAVLGSVTLGLPSGPFLRWAVLPALPAAACVVAAGLLVWFRGSGGGWHTWFRCPPASAAAAATGLMLIQYAVQQPQAATIGLLAGRLGGLLVGVAAALVLADRRSFQLILMALLGLFTALIVAYSTTGIIAMMYVFAAAAWSLRSVWRQASTLYVGDRR
jgi:hypothetical protein